MLAHHVPLCIVFYNHEAGRALPTSGEHRSYGIGGQHALAALPIDLGDVPVFHVERMLPWDGRDDLFCALGIAHRHIDPDIRQNIGKLTEKRVDALQSGGQ